MADKDTKSESAADSTALASSRSVFGWALAGAVAAGTGLFLWSRGGAPQGEQSTADEVQAHPS